MQIRIGVIRSICNLYVKIELLIGWFNYQLKQTVKNNYGIMFI